MAICSKSEYLHGQPSRIVWGCPILVACNCIENYFTVVTCLFTEDEKDAEANKEIEQMLERRRSSGQSHTSSGTAHDGPLYLTSNKAQSMQQQQQQQRLQSNRSSLQATETVKDNQVSGAEVRQIATHRDSEHDKDILSDVKQTLRKASSENLSTEVQADLPMHGIATSNDQELDDVRSLLFCSFY